MYRSHVTISLRVLQRSELNQIGVIHIKTYQNVRYFIVSKIVVSNFT